jgi:hypothetical protein
MNANVFVYGKLRFCERGISNGNSAVCKKATTFGLAKSSNFLYTLLANVFYFHIVVFHSANFKANEFKFKIL